MPSLFQQIQAGTLWDFHGGVHPPARKEKTSRKPIALMPMPERLYIPLRQHIGVAGRVQVQAGERVLKGQALTFADNSMAVPVHAPTSGHIIAINEHTSPHPSALLEMVIVLEPDGLDEWRPRQPLSLISSDNQSILARIQDSGIAGMGGAGFPTHIKAGMPQPVDYLIINAVECEPYITADDALMQEAPTTIVKGIDILCKLLNPKAVLIGIEADKPIAAAALKAACSQREHYYVREVPVKYPSGGEKQLIQLLTSKEVPAGRRPADIGIVMQNIGTVFAIAQAVLDDHPLISRIITITGDTLSNAQNVHALLGTPVSALLDFCGFQSEARQKVIMGGPMMGFALPDLSVPAVKTTNCILAPSSHELPDAHTEMDCIRCSACADACPATLLPQQLLWYSKAKDTDKLKEYNLADCIECGACAYVCPSEIPLVQYYRIAKADIREQQREALKAEQAKARFEARNTRLENEKQERLARNQQLAAARQQAQQQSDGASKVADALARIKAKQSDSPVEKNHEQIAAERELKKQQAREYQARKAAEQDTNAAQVTAPADSKNAAVAAAIARAKARKQTENAESEPVDAVKENTDAAQSSTVTSEVPAADPRQAAVAAAIARAKARKQTENAESAPVDTVKENTDAAQSSTVTSEAPAADPRQAAVAAAIARAKARKQAENAESAPVEATKENTDAAQSSTVTSEAPAADPRQAAVAAAIARAKARKQTENAESAPVDTVKENTDAAQSSTVPSETPAADPRQAAVAAAIARAKARNAESAPVDAVKENTDATQSSAAESEAPATDPRQAAVAAAIARAKARKQAASAEKTEEGDPS